MTCSGWFAAARGGVVDRVDGIDDGLQVAHEVVEADRALRQALRRQHGADRRAEVDRLRVRQDRRPRAGRARQRRRHDVRVHAQEHAADDAAERDADEVDAVAVEIGVRDRRRGSSEPGSVRVSAIVSATACRM